MVEEVWEKHLSNNNDLTSLSGVPAGCQFQIFTIETLRISHKLGNKRHRSEYCGLYVNENREDFKIEILPVPSIVDRFFDYRLSVDYPEDLILCRAVYDKFRDLAPRITLESIIDFLDLRPDLHEIIKPYLPTKKIW
jgi:spore coat polysaccharide biosynthesis protein SpsF